MRTGRHILIKVQCTKLVLHGVSPETATRERQRPHPHDHHSSVLKYLALCLMFSALPVLAVACRRSPSEEHRPPATQRTPQQDEQALKEIDRLRSLGYAGYTETQADETKVGVIALDERRSYPGYNLYSNHRLSSACLIDAKGNNIRSWQHAGSRHWANCELLPNGDLLVVGSEPSELPKEARPYVIDDSARYIMRLNWDGDVLWKRHLLVHHDIEVTPGGNFLVLAFERRFMPRIHPSIKVRDDHLLLLSPNGEILKSQSMLDAIESGGDAFPLAYVAPVKMGGEPWLDPLHSNSVEWIRRGHLKGRHPIFDSGNILVSFRHQDRIAVFNWKDNKAIWAWGKGDVFGPHDAQVLEDGHILLFDNGLGRKPAYSRVVELDPVTGKIVWEYRADPPETFYTLSRGSAQRLPNGNTLIANSDIGHAFEVTPEGQTVWEFMSPHFKEGRRATIARMRRYELSYVRKIMNAHERGRVRSPSR